MSPYTPDQSSHYPAAPPPPGVPMVEDEFSINAPERQRTRPKPGQRFEAELDASELDDRMRPGGTWTARARELSRSSMILMSRRMCYPGRLIVLAVHLIDDAPVPLMGRVIGCDYEADGLYRTELELLPIPAHGPIRQWVAARSRS
jgi:hypothetical protein